MGPSLHPVIRTGDRLSPSDFSIDRKLRARALPRARSIYSVYIFLVFSWRLFFRTAQELRLELRRQELQRNRQRLDERRRHFALWGRRHVWELGEKAASHLRVCVEV